MPYLPDDRDLTPEQRRREIASILARGVLRLCSVLPAEPEAPKPAPSPPQKDLEVSDLSRPHVPRG